MKNKSLRIFTALVAVSFIFAGCAPKKLVKTEVRPESPAPVKVEAPVTPAETVMPPEDGTLIESSSEADIRGGEFESSSELENIEFEFDAFSLNDKAMATMQKNAAILKNKHDSDILVEGHCDERGTIEYNIALGQKRANQVRDYYISLGVPAASISTISYGKEKPLCLQSTEDCWNTNRRAETKLRQHAAKK